MLSIEVDKCSCGGVILPVWYKEEEYRTENGNRIKTGRVRQACSHLACTNCMKRFIVDDSFDKPYR